MALDPADFPSELDITSPAFNEPVGEADDQIRTAKRALNQGFPNISAAVTVDQDHLNETVIADGSIPFTGGITVTGNSTIDGTLGITNAFTLDLPTTGSANILVRNDDGGIRLSAVTGGMALFQTDASSGSLKKIMESIQDGDLILYRNGVVVATIAASGIDVDGRVDSLATSTGYTQQRSAGDFSQGFKAFNTNGGGLLRAATGSGAVQIATLNSSGDIGTNIFFHAISTGVTSIYSNGSVIATTESDGLRSSVAQSSNSASLTRKDYVAPRGIYAAATVGVAGGTTGTAFNCTAVNVGTGLYDVTITSAASSMNAIKIALTNNGTTTTAGSATSLKGSATSSSVVRVVVQTSTNGALVNDSFDIVIYDLGAS